jgi:hypothetical protein
LIFPGTDNKDKFYYIENDLIKSFNADANCDFSTSYYNPMEYKGNLYFKSLDSTNSTTYFYFENDKIKRLGMPVPGYYPSVSDVVYKDCIFIGTGNINFYNFDSSKKYKINNDTSKPGLSSIQTILFKNKVYFLSSTYNVFFEVE